MTRPSNRLLTIIGIAIVITFLVFYESITDVSRRQISSTTNNLEGLSPEEAAKVPSYEGITLSAIENQEGIALQWTTKRSPTGVNYNYFTIERAIDGDPKRREKITRVKVIKGFSGPYEYLDNNGEAGKKYSYRILATLVEGDFYGTAGGSNDVEVIYPAIPNE